jgi:endonuclease G
LAGEVFNGTLIYNPRGQFYVPLKKKFAMRSLLVIFCMLVSAGISAQDYELLVQAPREQRVVHTLFTLSYSEAYELPSWVAYKLTPEQAKATGKFKEKYMADPLVTTGSSMPKDYRDAPFIMGQLIPVEDMLISPQAAEETFLMSNIVPQKPAFNHFVWKANEQLIREWAKEGSTLYIVAGPVLTDVPFFTFGPSKVSIPTRYYKVVLDVHGNRAIGFLFRANTANGQPKSFAVSVDEVEKVTGLDFFPSLPDDVEQAVESSTDFSKWNFKALVQ